MNWLPSIAAQVLQLVVLVDVNIYVLCVRFAYEHYNCYGNCILMSHRNAVPPEQNRYRLLTRPLLTDQMTSY